MKAEDYLDHLGYGSGTNFTTKLVARLMDNFSQINVDAEVEKMIAERMPSEEEIDDETIAWAAEHQCGTPFSERWIGFVKGAKWLRSRLSQKTDNLKENNNNGSTN